MLSWQEDFIKTKDGLKIFIRHVWPAKIKARLLLIHGYAEHSGRYAQLLELLASCGFECWAPDLPGHGRSARCLGDLASFQNTLNTLHYLLDFINRENGRKKYFILGHSLGGCLALCLSAQHKGHLAGTIAIAPMILVPDYVSPFLKKIAGILACLLPQLALQPFAQENISRNEAVLDELFLDPYCYRGKIKARTGYQMLLGIEQARQFLQEIKTPLLLLHGAEDKIMPVAGSQYILDKVVASDKQLHVFPNLYHEILNEKEKEAVFELILSWLKEHSA